MQARAFDLLVDPEHDDLRPFGELERRSEVALCEIEAVLVEQGPHEVHVSACRVVHEVAGGRDLRRLDELVDAVVAVLEQVSGAEVVQRMRERPLRADLARDGDRAAGQVDRSRQIVGEHRELCLVAQRQCVESRSSVAERISDASLAEASAPGRSPSIH